MMLPRAKTLARFAQEDFSTKDYSLTRSTPEDDMASKVKHRTATQNRLVAYAHPLRAAIFTILTERSASPAEMTRELGLERKDLSTVDYHTKKLVELDCAEVIGERKVGSLTEKSYKASERSLVETEEWDTLMADNPVLAEHFLGEFMQVQLDDYRLALTAGALGPDADFHITRTRRVLDAEGLAASLEAKERHRREQDEIERASAERRRARGIDASA